jgi:GntR family transcriptional regulator/MocR family aminotransferase
MQAHGWAELHDWRLDPGSETPLVRQIYIQISSAILSGVLGPGAKLLSTRAMASSLDVARTSVVAAYEQLLTEGYVDGRAGSGPLFLPS